MLIWNQADGEGMGLINSIFLPDKFIPCKYRANTGPIISAQGPGRLFVSIRQ